MKTLAQLRPSRPAITYFTMIATLVEECTVRLAPVIVTA
jgi:hypothetical protein